MKRQKIYQKRWIERIGIDEYRKLMNSYVKKYRSSPWVKTHQNINQRIWRSKNLEKWGNGYRCYVGIQNFLTPDDLKMLYERDNAKDMVRPSIDRKDSTGHYTVENCQYIEMNKNRAKVLNPGPKIGDKYKDGRICHDRK
jgi:hypothetical protein